jgi:beta-phosphoglucomutase-like phosphatase (HAD superfamily)
MSELKALLFDVDGTLVDTKELHRQAFNQAFLEFGLGWNWSDELYAELLAVSGGAERIAHYIDWLNRPAAEKTRLRRLISAVHREKTRIYGTLIASNKALSGPGVSRPIEEAHEAGLKIGLAASSAVENVHALLAAAMYPAQRDAIRAIVSANQVSRKKPAPDIYEMLLTQLGVPAVACVAFDDSTNGIAAAKAARLDTVATPSRWMKDRDFGDADLVVDSLGEPDIPSMPRASAERAGSGSRSLRPCARTRHSCAPRACRRERARC